ncbi:MAG TPA: RDD family protein [Thermoanaerobaculia bacterium]|nr:RDD family protein [Thermoanaerobaculia bacterium]
MICRNHVDVAEGVRRCTRCGGTYCSDCLVTIHDHPYCATCKTEQLMDVRSGVDRSRLTYGGFWQRFGAQFLDGVIVGVPAAAIAVAVIVAVTFTAQQNEAATLLILLAYIPAYVFPVLYEALMLSTRDGQTIGKKVLKLRVVRPDGSSISTGQAWGRAVMRLILGVFCAGIVDYIVFFFTEDKTTLHDMVAGTRVVESY